MSVSAGNMSRTSPPRLLDAANTLLLGTALFGLAVRTNSPGAGLAALVATIAIGAAMWMTRPAKPQIGDGWDTGERPLLLVALGFGVLTLIGWAPSTIGPTTQVLERLPGGAWAGLAVIVLLTRHKPSTRVLAVSFTVATLLITLLVGVAHLHQVDGVGLDVNLLHTAAADAIADGQNPYTDAVEVPNGSPTAEPGDTIVGYPYPPVTAISYAVGEWVFDDPRYTSLISWLVVLGLVGLHAIRRLDRTSLAVMLLLASVPGWPLVLRAGWSEPLSLLFMVAAFFTWKGLAGSGIFLGLGLASKQYFVVTAPVALLHRDQGWVRRLLVAVSVIVATVGVALVLDFEAFWSAAVEFHTSTPPRHDSSNLLGLLNAMGIAWSPPTILSLVVGLVAAVIVGRMSRTRRTFAVAVGFTLAVSFLVSSQAFANYWFLVFGLCVLGMLGSHLRPRALS